MALLLRRTRSLLVVALLALFATTAHAQYEKGFFNLSWDDCGASGTMQRNFACNTNSGSHTMYASAVLIVPMPQLVAVSGVLDLQTNQAALSPWWTYLPNPGSCRASHHFAAAFNGASSCENPWVSPGFGSYQYSPSFIGPNRARYKAIWAMTPPAPVESGIEYYMFSIVLSNARTTGLGSCSGCQDGVCIVLNSIRLEQPTGLPKHTIDTPLTRQFVVWQGGTGLDACPGATPVRSTTWGSIKSLYR